MKKGVTRRKVLGYIRKNPNAKAKEVAKAVGVGISCVYNVTHLARKAQKERAVAKAHGAAVAKTVRVLQAISKPDNVNHPPHYKVGGIEVIDFIESKKFNYNLGNVIKYVSRADHKGSRLEDLKKARWYLDREIGGGK
jgi:hypothetical protein